MAIDLNEHWNQHVTDAQGVLQQLTDLIERAEDPADLFAIGALGAHIAGAHLGEWDVGIALLERLSNSPNNDPQSAQDRGIHRLIAMLAHCKGDLDRASSELAQSNNPGAHADSARIRMLAGAAEALAEQDRIPLATEAFAAAEELASYGPDSSDPAARSLAIAGNNLACTLEGLPSRTAAQTALMKRAAAAGRRWWEVSGTWSNVSIAEYRLAQTHLVAGEPDTALVHANRALALCETNEADESERFFPWMAIAQAQLALGAVGEARAAFAEAETRVVDWGRAELEALRTRLAAV